MFAYSDSRDFCTAEFSLWNLGSFFQNAHQAARTVMKENNSSGVRYEIIHEEATTLRLSAAAPARRVVTPILLYTMVDAQYTKLATVAGRS